MSSKRRLRRNSCEGKIRHLDKREASAHWYALFKIEPEVRMTVYKCKFCKGWHVGHRIQKWSTE